MLEKNSSYRLVIYLVGFASIFIILSGIRALSSVINPILLALVITITVLPLPGRLNARGVPGWLSFVLTILLVVGILGLVILTVFFSVSRLSLQLPTYMTAGADQAAGQIQQLFNNPGFLLDQTNSLNVTLRSPVVQNVIAIAANIVLQFGLTLLIFFFMLSAAVGLPSAARLGLDPSNPSFGRLQGLTKDVRQYVTILTGINFLVGLGNTIFLYFLGIDYALLWGVLSWFMGYIPSVGFLIALIPPLLLAYVDQGPTTALIVLIGYIVINGGIQNFVQPKIMGDGLKLSPVVIFISLFVWAFLLGGIGAILAVPLTLLVVAIMEEFDGTRSAAALMRYTGRKTDENTTNLVKDATGQLKSTLTQFRQTFQSGTQSGTEE